MGGWGYDEKNCNGSLYTNITKNQRNKNIGEVEVRIPFPGKLFREKTNIARKHGTNSYNHPGIQNNYKIHKFFFFSNYLFEVTVDVGNIIIIIFWI